MHPSVQMNPEKHTEDVVLNKFFELLHVLMNRDKIVLLLTYIDSNGVLQSYGTPLVKAKWENSYNTSKSWPESFKTDQRILNATNNSQNGESERQARKTHFEESIPAMLPAPLISMSIEQLIHWLTNEIKREYQKRTGVSRFKLLLKKDCFEPPWWLSSEWAWSNVTESLSTQKFTGAGTKIDFMRSSAEACLRHYNLTVTMMLQ